MPRYKPIRVWVLTNSSGSPLTYGPQLGVFWNIKQADDFRKEHPELGSIGLLPADIQVISLE